MTDKPSINTNVNSVPLYLFDKVLCFNLVNVSLFYPASLFYCKYHYKTLTLFTI